MQTEPIILAFQKPDSRDLTPLPARVPKHQALLPAARLTSPRLPKPKTQNPKLHTKYSGDAPVALCALLLRDGVPLTVGPLPRTSPPKYLGHERPEAAAPPAAAHNLWLPLDWIRALAQHIDVSAG